MQSSRYLLNRRVFIVGGSITQFTGKGSPHFVDKKHPEFGKKQNPTIEEYITKATNDAFESTKVDPELVDRIAIGNFAGELFTNQGHMGACVIGANKKLMNKPSMRVEGACASGALAVQVAYDAIRSGSDVALAVGAEVQSTVSSRVGGDYLARASHYARQRPIDDFTFPCLFAKRMKGILEQEHFTMEDTARVATKAYANGNLNPLAHMHKAKISLEHASTTSDKNPNFLSNEIYKPFLRITDCSQVTDGASAMILVSEEGLKKINAPKESIVEIMGLACATGNLYEDVQDPTRMMTSGVAAARAQEAAGIKASDLHVAEVHDCFTIAELLMYEALGIAPYGGAKHLIRSGETHLEGKIPVNTGGGLLSFGHPVGATGIKQFMEIYRQMKGQCGAYQLKKIPTFGATLNMGGDDKTAVSSVLQNL
jgi:acetyl-CoA acetyltransferase